MGKEIRQVCVSDRVFVWARLKSMLRLNTEKTVTARVTPTRMTNANGSIAGCGETGIPARKQFIAD